MRLCEVNETASVWLLSSHSSAAPPTGKHAPFHLAHVSHICARQNWQNYEDRDILLAFFIPLKVKYISRSSREFAMRIMPNFVETIYFPAYKTGSFYKSVSNLTANPAINYSLRCRQWSRWASVKGIMNHNLCTIRLQGDELMQFNVGNGCACF